MLNNWIERLVAKVTSSSRPARTHGQRSRRPAQMRNFESQSLEDRILLANFSPAAAIGDGDVRSLRLALSQANRNGEDDVFTLEAGTYQLTLEEGSGNSVDVGAGGDLDIAADGGQTLTIRGAGIDQTTIQQTALSRVFEVLDGATLILEDLTITGGNMGTGVPFDTDENTGGGILSDGTLTLNNVRVLNNTASRPGGGVASRGNTTLSNVTFDRNSSVEAGGLYQVGGAVTATNVTFIGNRAAGGEAANFFDNIGGGAVLVGATGSFTNSTFTGNFADKHGGGIALYESTLTLTNTDLIGNEAGLPTTVDGVGGGLFILPENIAGFGGSNATITGGTIQDNIAFNGGGIFNATGGFVTIDGTQLLTNDAEGPTETEGGGGIYNLGGTLNISNATIQGNRAIGTQGSGGGLYSRFGDVTIGNTIIQANEAQREGGGVEIFSGTVTIENNSVLIGNQAKGNQNGAAGDGGGLHVTGTDDNPTTVNIFNSYVGQNTAANEGGGLWNANGATINLFNVFIDSNVASGTGGGGIYNDGGSVNVSTMFVSGNVANGTNGFGGGLLTVDADEQGAVIFGNVTIQNNSATFGGGVASIDGTLAVDNSAVRANVAADPQGAEGVGLGGGIYVGGTTASVGVTGTDVAGNTAGFAGGGIANQGSNNVAVFGSFVQSNSAGTFGGGLFNDGGSVFFDFSIVQNNTTEGFGGGIASLNGAVGLNSSAVFANSAAVFGGGIYNNASLFFSGGQLTNNNAQLGGGLFDDVGGAPFLDNVFTTGNLPDDIFDI